MIPRKPIVLVIWTVLGIHSLIWMSLFLIGGDVIFAIVCAIITVASALPMRESYRQLRGKEHHYRLEA